MQWYEGPIPNIQVPPERRRIILEVRRVWSSTLPRAPGQIGGAITTLVEGPPIYDPGEVMPYSDLEYVRSLASSRPSWTTWWLKASAFV